jgi:hypothetical protein
VLYWRGTLKDEAGLAAWPEEAEERIRGEPNDGPVMN